MEKINHDKSTINQYSALNDYNKTINKTDNHHLLFTDNKLWFQEKLSNYSRDLSLLKSEIYVNKTKRILVWTKDFGGNLGYVK